MIIPPPQQGQRGAGETASAWPSVSAWKTLGCSLGRSERLADAPDVAGSDRAGEEAVVMMWTASLNGIKCQGVTVAGRGWGSRP